MVEKFWGCIGNLDATGRPWILPFFASGYDDAAEYFYKKLRATTAEKAYGEAKKLTYHDTGCHVIDVFDSDSNCVAEGIKTKT